MEDNFSSEKIFHASFFNHMSSYTYYLFEFPIRPNDLSYYGVFRWNYLCTGTVESFHIHAGETFTFELFESQ